MISTGQYCRARPKTARTSVAACRKGSNFDINETTPSTLAVIASKTSVRNRSSTIRMAMIHNPLRTPRTVPATTTMGIPQPRRLMMPVAPPT